MPRANAATLLLGLLLGSALAANASANEVCSRPPASGPISLVILASAEKVHQLARSVTDGRPVVRDARTVIFDDGRVITADVEAASAHLNQLGWAKRRIQIAASVPAARARPRRARG